MKKRYFIPTKLYLIKTGMFLACLMALIQIPARSDSEKTKSGTLQASKLTAETKFGQRDISFPPKIRSIPKFLTLVSTKGGVKIIAPMSDNDLILEALEKSVSGKIMSVRDALDIFAKLSNLQIKQFRDVFVLQGGARIVSLARSPTSPTSVRNQALRLIETFDQHQMQTMFLQPFVSAEWLKKSQQSKYADLIKSISLTNEITGTDVKKLSTQEIVDLPMKFLFSYTASIEAIDSRSKNQTFYIGIFDYSRGLIHHPEISARFDSSINSKKTSLPIYKATKFLHLISLNRDVKDSQDDKVIISLPKTKVYTISEITGIIEEQIGHYVRSDQEIQEKGTKIYIFAGNYDADKLLQFIASSLGAELRKIGDVRFLGGKFSTDTERRKVIESLFKVLPLSPSIPFGQNLFANDTKIPYKKLSLDQQKYIEALFRNTDQLNKSVNLDNSIIHFADTFWFQGIYNDTQKGTGVSTFATQIY